MFFAHEHTKTFQTKNMFSPTFEVTRVPFYMNEDFSITKHDQYKTKTLYEGKIDTMYAEKYIGCYRTVVFTVMFGRCCCSVIISRLFS